MKILRVISLLMDYPTVELSGARAELEQAITESALAR